MIAAYSPARSLFRPSMSACLSKAMLCPPLCAAALLPNEPTDPRVACATPRGWYVLRGVQSVWLHPLSDRKPLRYRLEALARRIGPGDFLSEGGQARTVSAVDAEAVGGAELLLLQRLVSASRAALAVQSVRAVHWSWHRQRESPPRFGLPRVASQGWRV